jgi:predicted CoA-binding protein
MPQALAARRAHPKLGPSRMSDSPAQILRDVSVIAVVGLSRDPSKAAHSVPAALQAAGFRIIPVNPEATELLGEPCFPTLAAVPSPVDLVLVFRPARFAAAIAEQAVAIGAKALWLQLGIASAEAREIAERAGLRYVENRCAAVERARFGIVKAR